MKRIITICLLSLGFCISAQSPRQNACEVKPPADKEKFHIIILAGQSNMHGRGFVDYEDREIHPRVLVWNNRNWIQGIDPIYFLTEKTPGLRRGYSLANKFAQLYADAHPDITVGLVMCAAGGTSLAKNWHRENNCFKGAIAKAKKAGETGTIKMILWHQGETDIALNTPEYGEKLKKLIGDFREELGMPELPFILGEVPAFDRNVNGPGWQAVSEAIRRIPAEVPNTALAPADGLKDNGDKLHVSTESQMVFGERYFNAYEKLISGKK